MSEPLTMIAVASVGLIGLSIAVLAALKGWQGWLDLKPRGPASTGIIVTPNLFQGPSLQPRDGFSRDAETRSA